MLNLSIKTAEELELKLVAQKRTDINHHLQMRKSSWLVG